MDGEGKSLCTEPLGKVIDEDCYTIWLCTCLSFVGDQDWHLQYGSSSTKLHLYLYDPLKGKEPPVVSFIKILGKWSRSPIKLLLSSDWSGLTSDTFHRLPDLNRYQLDNALTLDQEIEYVITASIFRTCFLSLICSLIFWTLNIWGLAHGMASKPQPVECYP